MIFKTALFCLAAFLVIVGISSIPKGHGLPPTSQTAPAVAEPDLAQTHRQWVTEQSRNRLTAATNKAISQCRLVPSPQKAHDCEVSFLASYFELLSQIDPKHNDPAFDDVSQRIVRFETIIDEWGR